MNYQRFPTIILILFVTSLGLSQDRPHSYSGLQSRTIKALSEQRIQQLLNGEGIEQALPAELNGYPGPKHVLELAEELQLDPSTLAAVEQIRKTMQANARELGRKIVEEESALDHLFVTRTVDENSLRQRAMAIAHRYGELRIAHLAAHLEVTKVLTEEQRQRYIRLRGYSRHGGY